MASVRKEFFVAKDAAAVWNAVRDFGAVHTRLAPGFVVACKLNDETGEIARDITFANGMQARELLVGIDDEHHRLAYAITGGRAKHYNGSMQITPEGNGSRATWIVDVLPEALAQPISAMMDLGVQAMQRALASDPATNAGQMTGREAA